MTLAHLHPHRLLVALVAAFLIIGVLAPASTAATTRTLSLSAPNSSSTSTAMTFSGKLSKSPKGSAVTIQQLAGTRWVAAKSTRTTSTTGAYSVKVTLPAKGGAYSYRAVAAKKGALKAATSPTRRVTVLNRTVETLTATPANLVASGQVTLAGTVRPFRSGSLVNLQRNLSGSWVQVAAATLSTTGTFSLSTTVSTTTSYRASVPAAGLNAPATSAPVTVTVTAAPPPPAKPVISTSSLPGGKVGDPYATTLTATGNPTGTWTASPLPTGLSLNAATGEITGTPTASATTPVTIGFTQTSTSLAATAKQLDLVVDPGARRRSPPRHCRTGSGTSPTRPRSPRPVTLPAPGRSPRARCLPA